MRNFSSLSTLQGLNYLLPILILPYLIRVIGPEKFGLIAFAQAFVQYFMILTDYGFSVSATRGIALCRSDKQKMCSIFSSVITVKCILSALSFIIFIIIVAAVPKFRGDWPVYLLSFGVVIGNTLFPVWFFLGKEKMIYIAGINIAGGILYIIAIFMFVAGPADYLYVPLITSLFSIFTGISGLYIAFRKFGLEFVSQSYEDIRSELKAGWNIFISIVSINAYTTTRIFAVGLLTNNTITGYYSIAERIANFIQTFPLDSLSQAIYPRLNKIFAKNKKRAARLMHKIQTSVILTYLILIPALLLITPFIVRIICGTLYAQVNITLRLLLVSVFFVSANAFRVQFLLISDRADLYSKLHIIAALIGLPLIFLLTLSFSYVGTALSTTVIEAGIIIATLRLVKK
ncbi:MAG: oligosaccharide flippase family protein, partial [Candidatus Omnitrophica bacterium]|nr:oligosaccharide flippase family protein [Candidatus Omnitrophota bacterium]